MKLDTNTHGLFVSDVNYARQYACRVALQEKYPNYDTLGYQALTKGQPVFYYTSSSLGDSFHGLGLPTSSFRLVEDIKQLENFILEDQENQRIPLMVFTCVGYGVTEKLASIRSITKTHNMLIHVEGYLKIQKKKKKTKNKKN